MKRLLAFIVPILEIGGNNKPSFSRELYNLYIISESLEWNALFDHSAAIGEKCKLTIKGAKILERLASGKSSKIAKYNKMPFELDFRYDNNNGKNAEIALDMTFSAFIRATPEQDLNGIDFLLWDLPLQLKTFGHGIKEYYENVLEEKSKRSGISSVNCKLIDLINWEFPD